MNSKPVTESMEDEIDYYITVWFKNGDTNKNLKAMNWIAA